MTSPLRYSLPIPPLDPDLTCGPTASTNGENQNHNERAAQCFPDRMSSHSLHASGCSATTLRRIGLSTVAGTSLLFINSACRALGPSASPDVPPESPAAATAERSLPIIAKSAATTISPATPPPSAFVNSPVWSASSYQGATRLASVAVQPGPSGATSPSLQQPNQGFYQTWNQPTTVAQLPPPSPPPPSPSTPASTPPPPDVSALLRPERTSPPSGTIADAPARSQRPSAIAIAPPHPPSTPPQPARSPQVSPTASPASPSSPSASSTRTLPQPSEQPPHLSVSPVSPPEATVTPSFSQSTVSPNSNHSTSQAGVSQSVPSLPELSSESVYIPVQSPLSESSAVVQTDSYASPTVNEQVDRSDRPTAAPPSNVSASPPTVLPASSAVASNERTSSVPSGVSASVEGTSQAIALPQSGPEPALPQATPLSPASPSLTLHVDRFNVVGSTIFDRDQLNRFAQMIAMNPSDYASSDAIQNLCRQVLSQQDASKEALTTHPTLSNPTTSGEGVMGSGVTLADLTRVSDAITQCYTSQGYINSGAVISPDQLNTLNSSSSNTPIEVVIQIVEGSLEAINVNVSRPRGFLNTPLRASYVHQRLAGVSGAPFNVNKLVEAVQLLELDPVIDRISTRIVPGTRLGTSILNVEVTQADSFAATLSSNNDRSPSVGSVQQEATVSQANILGIGDRFNVGYTRTSGSDGVNLSYTLPVNAQNGTIQLAYGLNNSRVVEAPFDALDIRSDYHNYELSYRQPLVRSPNEEFALGLTASRQETTGDFLEALTGSAQPFPSRGADANGRTRLSALRFSQEWTKRGPNQVFALFSQLSLGLDLLDSTINASPPDSRFLAWQGQAQWVRQLAPDSLFLVRGSLQLADGPLVPLEQFGIGGDRTVRGYRSNTILADNGWLASAELRLPILRIPSIKGVLQIAPFFDAGGGWNNGNFDDPKPGTLVSTGLGLIWRMGDTLLARLDWGIPLISPPDRGGSLQESGIHFSISTSL